MTLLNWLRRTRSEYWKKSRIHKAHEAADHTEVLGDRIEHFADASGVGGAPISAPAKQEWAVVRTRANEVGVADDFDPPSTNPTERLIALEAMNHAVDAIFCVDCCGRIAWMNRSAEGLARQRDGVVVRGRRLTVSHRHDRIVLAHVLAAAGRHEVTEVTNTMPISRPSGRQPLRLSVQPLLDIGSTSKAAGDDTRWTTVMVIVACPDDPAVPSPVELAAVHGFTLAEARLAAALAAGTALTDYANAVGVTRETVRSQLKSIMFKADVHRQADLVRVILDMPTARWRCTH